jgi:acyl carrier protein
MLIMDKFGIPYKDELFLKYYTLAELIQNITRQEVRLL